MYKILIDLDVLTLAFWNKEDYRKEIALKFIKRVENEEFVVFTPTILIKLVLKWGNKGLVNKIENFYLENSENVISEIETVDVSNSMKIDFDKLVLDLYKLGIKKEDAALVLVTSIFNIDYLATFNRKHLKNNNKKINEVLKKNGLKEISIALPNEI